jgi:hypothetical protein
MQALFFVEINEIHHRRMHRVSGGTQVAHRFVEHQVQRGFSLLDQLLIEGDGRESIDPVLPITNDDSINPNAPLSDRHLSLRPP